MSRTARKEPASSPSSNPDVEVREDGDDLGPEPGPSQPRRKTTGEPETSRLDTYIPPSSSEPTGETSRYWRTKQEFRELSEEALRDRTRQFNLYKPSKNIVYTAEEAREALMDWRRHESENNKPVKTFKVYTPPQLDLSLPEPRLPDRDFRGPRFLRRKGKMPPVWQEPPKTWYPASQTSYGDYYPEFDYLCYPRELKEAEERAYDPFLLVNLRAALKVPASNDPTPVWRAYHELSQSHPLGARHLHPATLHRIAMHLVKRRPRTREGYLQLLSVLTDLRRAGAIVRTYQWNALADFAGKGFERTTLEDWQATLAVFRDMLEVRKVIKDEEARRLSSTERVPDRPGEPVLGPRGLGQGEAEPGKPDITTYNTLISVAVRSRDPNALNHAIRLLEEEEGPTTVDEKPVPDQITLLSFVPFYSALHTPERGVEVLRAVIALGQPLRIGAFTNTVWAYARNKRLDVARQVYDALRAHQAQPDGEAWKAAVPEWQHNPILSLEGLVLPPDLKLETIMYSMMVQQYCVSGQLGDALRVLMDMIAPPSALRPNVAVFRAIFLGFARHAGDPRRLRSVASLGLRLMTKREVRAATRRLGDVVGRALGMEGAADEEARAERARTWNLATLDQLFGSYLNINWSIPPTPIMIYWILLGYAKASGNDWVKLLDVWQRLEAKFGEMEDWPQRVRTRRVIRVVTRIRQGAEENERRRLGESGQPSKSHPPAAPSWRRYEAEEDEELWDPEGEFPTTRPTYTYSSSPRGAPPKTYGTSGAWNTDRQS